MQSVTAVSGGNDSSVVGADSPLNETAYLAETAERDTVPGRSSGTPAKKRSAFRDPLLIGLWFGGAAIAVASVLLYLWSGRLQWLANYAFQTDDNGNVISTGNPGGLQSVLRLQFLQSVTPTLFLIGVATVIAATLIAAHRRSARR
jgi:hypothetical protein